MAETISIRDGSKTEVYEQLLPQVAALMDAGAPSVSNMANMASALKTAFPAFSWVGFYLAHDQELIVGPFQGKPACVRIAAGQGVCGTSFAKRSTVVVPDVHAFPGHIACDPDSRSEIVVPLLDGERCYGVLDVDSNNPDAFDETDAEYLRRMCQLILPFLRKDMLHA